MIIAILSRVAVLNHGMKPVLYFTRITVVGSNREGIPGPHKIFNIIVILSFLQGSLLHSTKGDLWIHRRKKTFAYVL